MPWDLEIGIIDVEQGESSLIVARDTVGAQHRSMLIDAGLPIHGHTAHSYVNARLGALNLTHMLVSHYDADHSGGIKSLLIADNLYRLCEIIAQAAGAAAFNAATNAPLAGQDQDHQIAAAAAAASAAALGAYNVVGNNQSNIAVNAGQAQWNVVIPGATPNAVIARDAAIDGEGVAGLAPNLNPSLLPFTVKRRSAAQRAGISAGLAAGAAAVRAAAALPNVLQELYTTVPQGSRFNTGGRYTNIHVIDIGNTAHMANDYPGLIAGDITFTTGGSPRVRVPGINRTRTTAPALGAEIFWNSGPGAAAAPVGSPAIFVVSRLKSIWRAPAHAIPIASGQPDNDDSIGLILRFNNFFYYTGGDLPWQGEDLIANAVMANRLPDPQNPGNPFALPARIACFKCGHHGSDHSTSANFLAAVLPRAACISSGYKPFGRTFIVHPEQNVVNRLHGDGNIQFFFMTNCREQRANVPASQNPPQNQLPGPNKSRLAGDNQDDNTAPPAPPLPARNRGDVRIKVTNGESTAAVGPGRQFRIRYFEADAIVNANRTEPIQF
jgi:beta-lactamase superfamily II metal-dependent hydrolase